MWCFIQSSIYCFVSGRFLNNRVVRRTGSKWYVSREIWPRDHYPTWFQGLAYFLSANITGPLYQAAQQCHYMHTDDVFVGIAVEKMTNTTNHVLTVTRLDRFSVYTLTLTNLKKHIGPAWDNTKGIFYHVPETLAFWAWAAPYWSTAM